MPHLRLPLETCIFITFGDLNVLFALLIHIDFVNFKQYPESKFHGKISDIKHKQDMQNLFKCSS